MFKRTTAINKLLNGLKNHSKLVVQGGTYAGKTYGIMAVLINYAALNPKKRIAVIAETLPAVKAGALRQFIEIMEKTGRFSPDRLKAGGKIDSGITYRFANGSFIEFRSFDSVGKAKASAKRDVLFINEANHVKFEIASALMDRTEEKVIIDFNPDAEFWAHTEVLTEPGAGFLLLKYTDNEGCPPAKIEMLESRREKAKTSDYWANWCRVYIDGEIGTLQGACISDWEIVDRIPDDVKLVGHGLDFGFEPDPSACVTLYESPLYYVADEVFYQTRMSPADYVAKLKPLSREKLILCDHNTMLITELSKAGLRVNKAHKPPGSIEAGLIRLNQKKLLVTSRSVNLIRELRAYVKDENGDYQGADHAIDALRYANSRPKTQTGFSK